MSQEAAAPTWDLTSYFPSFDGPEYRSHRDRLEQVLPELGARAAELEELRREDIAAWAELLQHYEEAMADYSHLASYVGCLNAADTTNEAYKREEARLARLGAAFKKAIIPLLAAIRRAGDEEFNALAARPELEGARYPLERLRWQARHSMAPELETLAADLNVDGISAWGRLYSETAGRLEFDLEWPDGRVERVPMSQKVSLLQHPDPRVRRAVLEGSNRAWEQVEHVAAACLNGISGTRLTLYRYRGVEHFLDVAMFEAGVERRTIDTMWQAVERNREVVRRYLRRKAAIIGKPQLGFQDLTCPLPLQGEQSFSWAEATRLVLAAFNDFYPALGEFAGSMLQQRQVEAEKRPGKRPGAFCTTSLKTRESRVFMTYGGSIGDVHTLAHEIGHGFHSWVMRSVRPLCCDYPMTLAETASTFAESILSKAILENPAISDQTKAQVLTSRLDHAAIFLLDIHMRYLFETRVYQERADGELGSSRLRQLMLDSQRECFGDVLAADEMDPLFWASKLHFYITGVSFYNFPYTFGYLLSSGLLAAARRQGSAFFPQYEELLRLTGAYQAEEVVRRALGIELSQPEFWQEAIAGIAEEADQYEEVVRRVL